MPRDSAFSRAGTQAQSASFDSMHSSTPIPNGKSVFYECVRFTWTKNRHFGQAIQFANRIVSDKIHYRVRKYQQRARAGARPVRDFRVAQGANITASTHRPYPSMNS